ncbi:unnamed protein product, partial [marine sediment metagenome]
ASSRYFEIRNLGGPTSLLAYRSAQVEPFDPSPMLGAVPQDVVAAVRQAVAGKLAEIETFQTGGGKPTLLIRGKFMDYDSVYVYVNDMNVNSALRDFGFDVDPFLTAQVEIVDVDTKRVLGVAMVTGAMKRVGLVKPEQLAEGVGKAVKGLLEAHMKKPE